MVRALEKRKTKMRYAILHPDRVFVAPLLILASYFIAPALHKKRQSHPLPWLAFSLGDHRAHFYLIPQKV